MGPDQCPMGFTSNPNTAAVGVVALTVEKCMTLVGLASSLLLPKELSDPSSPSDLPTDSRRDLHGTGALIAAEEASGQRLISASRVRQGGRGISLEL